MKNINKNGMLLAVLAFASAVLVAVTAVYGWFIFGTNPNSGNILIYSGDFDMEVEVRSGKDINRDGTLDTGILNASGDEVFPENVYNAGGTLVNAKSSRSDITTYLYDEVDRIDGSEYPELIEGMSITLKIIIKNTSPKADALADICFSSLSDYFYACDDITDGVVSDDLTDAELVNILGANTARIMFSVNNIKVRTYVSLSGSSDYSVLTGSTVSSEVSSDVRALTLNSSSADSFNLWELSSSEYFVENALVKSGELMEIDFNLVCLNNDEIYSGYSAYWEAYITDNTSLTAIETEYIRWMYLKELAYIVSDDQELSGELAFSIGNIYIFGTQTVQ